MSAKSKKQTRPHTPGQLGRVRAPLLDWYDANARDLPWRKTQDPYAIWISETMLQQTRVDTVIPYYTRFLEHFPDLASLARADLESVYSLWTGLGYYSRARNLHSAAQSVVADWGGALPDQADALRELKGIGRYTAGALASIAFDREEPVVDGNVIRVLARLVGIREDVGESKRNRSASGAWPANWSPVPVPAISTRPSWNSVPRSARRATPPCEGCPLESPCVARAQGDPAQPCPSRKSAPPCAGWRPPPAWIERRGRVLGVQRPEGGLLGGLWELPGGDLQPGETPEAGLRRCLAESLGLEVDRARDRREPWSTSSVIGGCGCTSFASPSLPDASKGRALRPTAGWHPRVSPPCPMAAPPERHSRYSARPAPGPIAPGSARPPRPSPKDDGRREKRFGFSGRAALFRRPCRRDRRP